MVDIMVDGILQLGLYMFDPLAHPTQTAEDGNAASSLASPTISMSLYSRGRKRGTTAIGYQNQQKNILIY
jgi:hypothetical protein